MLTIVVSIRFQFQTQSIKFTVKELEKRTMLTILTHWCLLCNSHKLTFKAISNFADYVKHVGGGLNVTRVQSAL